jgi:hypothetical protein
MKIFFFAFCLLNSLSSAFFFTPEMISSHMTSYTEAEKELIEKDLVAIRSLTSKEGSSSPFYLATAGSPGSRKTTILENFMNAHPDYQEGIYLDPDARALKFMINTYYNKSLNSFEIAKASSYASLLKEAYDKWRGASNYITLTLLEEAFGAKKSVVYGTTSTGGHITQLFPALKQAGYRTVLLLCYCEDEMRKEAISYRNEVVGFYQSSPEDAVLKGSLFPKRMEVYFKEANELYFYWSDGAFAKERLAATLIDGQLRVYDKEAFEKFAAKYEKDRDAMKYENVQLLPFNKLLEGYARSSLG